MLNIKPVLIAGLAVIAVSSQTVLAQGYAPYGNGYASPYNNQAPAPYGYGNQYGYGNPYANPNGNRSPYGYGTPYGYPQNNSGFKRFFNGNNGPFGGNSSPFGGNRNIGEQFWPGRGSIYDDALPANGPWNRNWGRAPWNRDYENLWEPDGGPSKWFDPSDPKEGMAWAWEDMMVTPNALGTMPGGWEAPSISIPNPVDVGDEFKNAAGDMPEEMRDFSDGFTYGDGYGNSDNYNSNRGIGFGNKKKNGGINIKPKNYR